MQAQPKGAGGAAEGLTQAHDDHRVTTAGGQAQRRDEGHQTVLTVVGSGQHLSLAIQQQEHGVQIAVRHFQLQFDDLPLQTVEGPGDAGPAIVDFTIERCAGGQCGVALRRRGGGSGQQGENQQQATDDAAHGPQLSRRSSHTGSSSALPT